MHDAHLERLLNEPAGSNSPPYLHNGRLLTLADTAEFCNLVLSTQLGAQEKTDLVAYLRPL